MAGLQSRPALWLAVIVAGVASVHATSRQDKDPQLSTLLTVAGTYVAEYERAFAAIVSEEVYEQTDNYPTGGGPKRRVTASETLTFNAGGSGWMVFRNVLDVDGTPAGSQAGRLEAVAVDPSQQALSEAMRLTAESARYNLGAMKRPITVPTAALTYLRRENQPQSTFAFDGMKTVAKLSAALVTFTVTEDQPATDDATTTTGRMWIEPESGRVVRSELAHTSRNVVAKVEVQYAAAEPPVAVWVPVRMFEQYDVIMTSQAVQGRGGRAVSAHVDGLATYRDCRQFELKAGLRLQSPSKRWPF